MIFPGVTSLLVRPAEWKCQSLLRKPSPYHAISSRPILRIPHRGRMPRNPRPRGVLPDRSRPGPDAGLHACGHSGHRQGHHAGPAPGDLSAGNSWQYLSLRASPGGRAGGEARGAAPFHGLGRSHPHRLRRLPGLLPGLPAEDERGGGHLPEPHRRQPPVPVPGTQPGDPAEPGLGHLHGPGRVPAWAAGALQAGGQHGPHHPLAGPQPGRTLTGLPGPLRHQPGGDPPGLAPPAPGRGPGAGCPDPLPGLRRGRPQRG